jgi:hypothetical protein
LEVRYLRARQEDVLAGLCSRLLLLDLQLHHLGGMLDNLGNVGPVTRADFAEDTLVDPNDTPNQPIALTQEYVNADQKAN